MAAPINTSPIAIDTDTSTSVRNESLADSTMTSPSTVPSSPNENGFPPVKEEQHRASPFTKYLQHNQEGVYHLQEAVSTTLFRASPALLTSFVDPTVSSFKAIYQSEKQLVIWRKGNAAFIGIFENHKSMRVFGFQHLVGVAIGYDSSWRILKGAGNAFCEPKWTEVWTGKYSCFGGVNRMVVEGEDMEVEKVRRAALLATEMLEGQFWTAKVDVKTT